MKYKNIYFYITLCILIFLLFGIFTHPDVISWIFSTDTLVLAAAYRDFIIDKFPINTFLFTPAPYFFPDMFFVSIFNFITNNIHLAELLFSLYQFFFFLLFFCLILKMIINPPLIKYSYLLFSAIILEGLILNSQQDMFLLLLPGFHVGSLVVSITF